MGNFSTSGGSQLQLYIRIAWGAVKSPQNQAAFQTKPISSPCGAQTATVCRGPQVTRLHTHSGSTRLPYQALMQKGGTEHAQGCSCAMRSTPSCRDRLLLPPNSEALASLHPEGRVLFSNSFTREKGGFSLKQGGTLRVLSGTW